MAMVDGNHMFNRPGPRLLDALDWLVGLLHGRPDLMPPGFMWRMWGQELAAEGLSAMEEAAEEAAGAPVAAAAGVVVGTGAGGADGGGCLRVNCAPEGLSVEIEEAHEAACCRGKQNYLDPRTGYVVSEREGPLQEGPPPLLGARR